MPRGNHNHGGRGGRGGRGSHARGSPYRGPWRGNGRGGRGRGKGGRGGGGGSGGGHMDEFDFPIQQWPADQPPTPGYETPRGRGRARGRGIPNVFTIHLRGSESPRGQGRGRGDIRNASPRGNSRGGGRGAGYLNSKLRVDAPLSKLLFEDRPLLKPIVFVRSVHTATLFQSEDDILQPVSESAADNEESHVPTADQVTRIFSGVPEREALSSSSEDEEALEEIDFKDIGRLQAEVDAAAALVQTGGPSVKAADTTIVEEKFTGFYIDTTPSGPNPHPTDDRIPVGRTTGVLGEQLQDDEEVIVYVAPHPRIKASQPQEVQSQLEVGVVREIPKTSFLTDVGVEFAEGARVFGREESTPETIPSSVLPPPAFESVSFSFDPTPRRQQTRRAFPVGGGPRSLLRRSKKARRKSARHFGSYGAMLSEAHLQQEAREKDPRESEQRRGDSDINWGDSDTDAGVTQDAVDEISSGMGAMDLDGEVSLEAMKSFVTSMGAEGSRHVTMDDIADIARMHAEDVEEEKGINGTDGDSSESEEEDKEVEQVIDEQERALIGDREDDSAEEGSSEEYSDDETTPKTAFKTKLEKIRAQPKGKQKVKPLEESSDEAMSVQMVWDDEDEDMDDDEFFDEIEACSEMLEEHAAILTGRDRRIKKQLFRAISEGLDSMVQPAPRKKDKYIPSELQEQWNKDRAKKAENKRRRAEDRLALAMDPIAVHKGGKKGRKAMLAAAKLDSSEDMPNRITNFVSLEQQIRRFIFDLGGKSTMALPPANKETRKKIHELANAFNLKSESKGKGNNRYTTLIKTTRTGTRINENKIKTILRVYAPSWDTPGREGYSKKGVSLAKHQEGEEVGKMAPKIGETNIGFKMLAAMGWSEGNRIGLSGGLDAPLTAIMKKTKLGLGAALP
ncbi:uncharacterized protein FIBRA_00186 [Fibroporia radiculosa]|uniref:Protein SQS1 n=1 Tax=Fibroporia radiculosa TaxID=599839 RepID=J7RGK2_9APHY|nr:uncharacterized protein FIBRA_00186 [Fibroporia radiculosa]CCL98192.1 predicted protein [Fibroporia radiculosa]